jgi:hypothetical protein
MPHPISATFREFLWTLKMWERDLFQELAMDVNCYEFLELVNKQELEEDETRLHTVSDGSDDLGSMSFGWVIDYYAQR